MPRSKLAWRRSSGRQARGICMHVYTRAICVHTMPMYVHMENVNVAYACTHECMAYARTLDLCMLIWHLLAPHTRRPTNLVLV